MLRPAGEPVPALRYRILPGRLELVPGNAAIFYHRAIQMMFRGYRRAWRTEGRSLPRRITRSGDRGMGEWADRQDSG